MYQYLYERHRADLWKHLSDGYANRFTLFYVMTKLEHQVFHRMLNPI